LTGFELFHEGLNDGFRVQVLEIGVRLTGPDEDDRLPGDVGHRNRGADLEEGQVRHEEAYEDIKRSP